MGAAQPHKADAGRCRLTAYRAGAGGVERCVSARQQRHSFPYRCRAQLIVERGERQVCFQRKREVGRIVCRQAVAFGQGKDLVAAGSWYGHDVKLSSCSSRCMECHTSGSVSRFRRKQIIRTFRISCQKRSGTFAFTLVMNFKALSAIGFASSGKNHTIATEASITKPVSGARSVSIRRSRLE